MIGTGRRVVPNLVAAAVDAAVAGAYLALVASQSGPGYSARTMGFFALLSATAALCLLSGLGAARFPQASDDLRLSAAAGNLGLGILGLASIGAPLLVVGLVLAMPARTRTRSLPRRLLAPTITVFLIVLVMLATSGR